MSRLIQFFFQSSSFFTFLVLEMFCFYLIVNFNSQQRDIYLESLSVYTGSVTKQVDELNSYIGLKKQVAELQSELAHLQARLPAAYYSNKETADTLVDDSLRQRFIYEPTEIISKSPYGPNNSFIINKGQRDSIYKGQGIVSPSGIVGIVTTVAKQHARALSVLHRDVKISAGLRNGYFGTLVWDGKDPRFMHLEDLKDYVSVQLGDTVFTTAYSGVFPTDIAIGTVEKKGRLAAEGSWILSVALLNEPLRLRHVHLVKDLYKDDLAPLFNNNR